jgi:hypothetical protein
VITASPGGGPRWLLADWLELEALCSPSASASIYTINSDSVLDADVESEEIDEEDLRHEQRISRLTTEVENRQRALGDAYPFALTADGGTLERGPGTGVGAIVYLFCLLASHGRSGGFLSNTDVITMTDVPDLLQACATWSAAGYEQGPGYAVGLDPAPGPFIAKLATIYAAFGDGTPVGAIPRGAPAQVKDDGIDIIAWKAMPDRRAPADYLMAQVASGRNWREKTVKKAIDRFHATWFTKTPARTAKPAMMIPFCIDAGVDDDEDMEQEALAMQWRRFIAAFGELFYRYLLPVYAARGLKLAAEGTHVDMADWLPRIETFVRDTVGRLQAGSS